MHARQPALPTGRSYRKPRDYSTHLYMIRKKSVAVRLVLGIRPLLFVFSTNVR